VSSTRDRILDETRRLTGAGIPSMSAVARAVGISRQALYLHFPSRAALLLALVEHVDAHEDLAGEIARVEAAPDGPGQVRAWVEMQVRRNPRIAPLARALDQARREDDAAAAAWRDRSQNRLRGATAIVRRLQDEGRVGRGWSSGDAATLLWELVSFRVWDDLVNEARMPPARYVDVVTATALAALAAPAGKGERADTSRPSAP
jgi:AcrR family transcriptional regulator